MMSENYQTEPNEILQKLENIETTRKEQSKISTNIIEFADIIKDYTNIEELTGVIVNALIDRIEVSEKYQDEKGVIKQRVAINYKYVGNIQSVSYKVPINRVYFPIENKICVECDKEYTPKSNVQKYCLECKKIIRRKQQNESKRKSREKAKLNEKCA